MYNKFAPFLFALSAAVGSAAPQLQLTQTALGPLVIAQGQNGPAQSVDARNLGDGSLNLQVSSSASWLAPKIGSPHGCGFNQSCIPVQMALQTSALAKGSYTAVVTLSDPNAVDAPQTITVTINVGTNVPDNLEFFVPPGGTTSSRFYTASPATVNASDPWLSVALDGNGSILFNVPYKVTASPQAGMGAGDYNGTLTVSGSSLAADNKSVPVVLHVTTQPIAQPTSTVAGFRMAAGAAKQTFPIAILNAGQGTITVSSAAVSGGSWLTAATNGALITLTADSSGLSPGQYTATLTVSTNAANPTLTIPVQLTVQPASGPMAAAGGALNNVTYGLNESLAQGDFVAIFGDQLTLGDPAGAPSFPFMTNFNGVEALLNGQNIPVQYVSYYQVNVQIPYDAQIGAGTLQLRRDGQAGNMISVDIAGRAPRLYQVFQTPQFTLVGDPANPVKSGDVLILYGIGFGQTNPPATAGAATPSSPFFNIDPTPQVCFGMPGPFNQVTCTTPFFAGLTPGYAGLYQVNFTVPPGVPAGSAVPLYLQMQDTTSNVIHLAIQ